MAGGREKWVKKRCAKHCKRSLVSILAGNDTDLTSCVVCLEADLEGN